MKVTTIKISAVFLMLACAIITGKDKSLKYIPEKPKAGDEITIFYNSEESVLSKAEKIELAVYSYSINSLLPYHIIENRSIELVKESKYWTAKYSIPLNADISVFKFTCGKLVDNNDQKGYFIRIYDAAENETFSSEMAYATALTSWGAQFGFAAENNKTAFEILNKNIMLRPECKMRYIDEYLKAALGAAQNDLVISELAEMEKNKDLEEKQYLLIIETYRKLKMEEKSNEIEKYALSKYKKGIILYSKRTAEFNKENSITNKFELFRQIENEFKDTQYSGNMSFLMFMNLTVQGKYDLIKDWWDITRELGNSRFMIYNIYIDQLIKAEKEYDIALKIAEAASDAWAKKLADNTKDTDTSQTAADINNTSKNLYSKFLLSYGRALYLMNKKEDSFEQYKKVFSIKGVNEIESKDIEYYLDSMPENMKLELAKPLIEKSYSVNKVTQRMKDILKEVYIKKYGNEEGFNDYIVSFDKIRNAKIFEELKAQMINLPAPNFELLDLEGKKVSLSDYKGKIVVLDFWATWCGPCKASFKGMQEAVNKYAGKKDVAFLFIDTSEKSEDKRKNASDFMTENGYSFYVLIDEKNKALTDFKVGGIPAKFIIDKNSNIRFKVVGYDGKQNEMVEELSNMIMMLEKE